MNLVELYATTPVNRHSYIRVFGDIVFVRDDDGNIDEYRILDDGELWLVHSDREQKQSLKDIKTKLGITETPK